MAQQHYDEYEDVVKKILQELLFTSENNKINIVALGTGQIRTVCSTNVAYWGDWRR